MLPSSAPSSNCATQGNDHGVYNGHRRAPNYVARVSSTGKILNIRVDDTVLEVQSPRVSEAEALVVINLAKLDVGMDTLRRRQ